MKLDLIISTVAVSLALAGTAYAQQPKPRDHRNEARDHRDKGKTNPATARPERKVREDRPTVRDHRKDVRDHRKDVRDHRKDVRDHRKDVRDHRKDVRDHRKDPPAHAAGHDKVGHTLDAKASGGGVEVRDHRSDIARKRLELINRRLKAKKLRKEHRPLLERAHKRAESRLLARLERREKQLQRARLRVKALGGGKAKIKIQPSLHAEMKRHARRTARLQHLMGLTVEVEDYESLALAEQVLERENQRHDAWLDRYAIKFTIEAGR